MLKPRYKYIGIIELHDNNDEYHHYYILESKYLLVFGSPTNSTFLIDGIYKKKDIVFETPLTALYGALECYHLDGHNTDYNLYLKGA